MGDGNLHRHFDLPTLTAGKLGGKLKTGYHHAFPSNIRPSSVLSVRERWVTFLLPYLEQNALFIHYNPALNWSDPANLPVATRAAGQILCLPIYEGLEEADQDRVIEMIRRPS